MIDIYLISDDKSLKRLRIKDGELSQREVYTAFSYQEGSNTFNIKGKPYFLSSEIRENMVYEGIESHIIRMVNYLEGFSRFLEDVESNNSHNVLPSVLVIRDPVYIEFQKNGIAGDSHRDVQFFYLSRAKAAPNTYHKLEEAVPPWMDTR